MRVLVLISCLFGLGIIQAQLHNVDLPYNPVQQMTDRGTPITQSGYPADRDDSEPWSFLHYSDIQPYASKHHESVSYYVMGPVRNMRRIVADPANRIRFALNSGDNCNDGDLYADWMECFFCLDSLIQVCPVFPTFGNHDGSGSQFRSLWELPKTNPANPETSYWFRYKNALFIFMDYRNPSGQYQWVESLLKTSTDQHIFILNHSHWYYGRFADGRLWSCDIHMQMNTQYVGLFDKYKHKITAILSGHRHGYLRLNVNGVRYIVNGAAAYFVTPIEDEEPGAIYMRSDEYYDMKKWRIFLKISIHNNIARFNAYICANDAHIGAPYPMPLDSFMVTKSKVGAETRILRMDGAPLLQVRPNPFISTVTLSVNPGLCSGRNPVLSIMGLNGRILWTGVMEGPDYSMSWDGRDRFGKPVAPGAYFVKVSGQDRTHIKKFILQK